MAKRWLWLEDIQSIAHSCSHIVRSGLCVPTGCHWVPLCLILSAFVWYLGFENSIKNGFYLILQKLLNWSLIMQRNEKKNDDIQQLVKLFSHIKQHVKVNYIKNKL